MASWLDILFLCFLFGLAEFPEGQLSWSSLHDPVRMPAHFRANAQIYRLARVRCDRAGRTWTGVATTGEQRGDWAGDAET
jgi:hypothetical protein